MASPIKITYYDACRVKTQAEADEMLQNLVACAMEEIPFLNIGEALAIQRSNIGYATGDLPNTPEGIAQKKLVLELYDTEHPIFGKYEKVFTPEECCRVGMTLAQAMQETDGDITESIRRARASL